MYEIKNNDTFIFLGDSVTDCGRVMPRGEGGLNSGTYGDGYPNFFMSIYRALHPENRVRFINKGVGGNQTKHILERLDDDVLSYKPDIITLCIGINDVWRLFDESQINTGVKADEFEINLRQIIERILAVTDKLLLITPYMIDLNTQDPMVKTMREYVEIVKRLADEYKLPVFDLQDMFDTLMKKGVYSHELSGDRIHPSQLGHASIAINLLRMFGENI